MAKGWKKWVIAVIILLVILGIAVGVLFGLGYLKNIRNLVPSPSGGCNAPYLLNTQSSGSAGLLVTILPPSDECLKMYDSIGLLVTNDETGATDYGYATKELVSGKDSFVISYPGAGSNSNGTATVAYYNSNTLPNPKYSAFSNTKQITN